MHQLVRKNVSEERSESQISLLRRRKHYARDWNQSLIELRILHVLQHDSLRALFLNHALVIRQIERSGLHTTVSFARAKNFVHDANRRRRAKFRIAILRVERQMVFEFLQVLTELFELCRLSFIS